jgi:hypothetical protein
VTPLLVKLYVEKALRLKGVGDSLDELPKSIPDTYFEFLRVVNPQDVGAKNRLSEEEMFVAAEVMARIALGEDFVSKEFRTSTARSALNGACRRKLEEADPIQRLVDNGVLRREQAGTDALLRFTLDPVAEFLCAGACAKEFGSDPERWNNLDQKISERGAAAEGFQQALRLTRQSYRIPIGSSDLAVSAET